MISAVNSSYTSYIQPMGSLQEKVSVPVVPSQALYSNLKHVQGIPDSGGVTLDKLQIIDGLIGFYNTFKEAAAPKLEAKDLGPADQALETLAAKVHDITKNTKTYGAPLNTQGLMLNMMM